MSKDRNRAAKRAHGQSPRALSTETTSRFLTGVELIRAGEYFAAHEAGFDQVLVKNALQERAPQIVEELIATVE